MTRPLLDRHLDEVMASLPTDRAFDVTEAEDLGLTAGRRRLLIEFRRLVRPLPGVFHHADLADTLDLRLQCLSLVVPTDCVITDRTAAWLWVGERALAPGDHLRTPKVSAFAPPGRRLRNALTVSGERTLLDRDVVELGGLSVTAPLRTACDQGRLLTADQGFAAMDSLATLRVFTVPELEEELRRFKGHRGVVQARTWAPYVDPGSDSQFESIGRKRWVEAGLPRPQYQVPEMGPDGGNLYVDFGLPDLLFGGEYFGEEFHGEDQEPHDESRLAWLRDARRWVIVVARRDNVVGPHQDLEMLFRVEWQRHQANRRRLIA